MVLGHADWRSPCRLPPPGSPEMNGWGGNRLNRQLQTVFKEDREEDGEGGRS